MKSFLLFGFWLSIALGFGSAMDILIRHIMIPVPNTALRNTLSDLEYLVEQIEQFYSITHQYPRAHEELSKVLGERPQHLPLHQKKTTEGPCLLISVKDPWGQKYRYCFPDVRQQNAFDLFSLGQDGQPGTKDDIHYWDRSNLDAIYGPSWFRKLFFDDHLSLGTEVVWFGMIILMEMLSLMMGRGSLLKETFSVVLNSSIVKDMNKFVMLGLALVLMSSSGIFILFVTSLHSPYLPLLNQLSSDLSLLSIKLEQFFCQTGQYPSTHEELFRTFSQEPTLNLAKQESRTRSLELLVPMLDPWRQNYRYLYPGDHYPESFDLWSLGADGQKDTVDDVKNWETSWERYYGPGWLSRLFQEHPVLWSLVGFWLGIAWLFKGLEWLFYGRTSKREG